MQICAFRLDDITPDMNWDNFYRIKSIFDKHGVKPLIGVVPDNRDEKLSVNPKKNDFWDIIRGLQEAGWSIAQHGYQHLYESRNGGLLKLKDKSEFAGLSYEVQSDKIKRGKNILEKEGILVRIFMAPGHTFDAVTLRVLYENRILYITDGYSSRAYIKGKVTHIPSRSSKPALCKGIDTICLHANHMNTEEIAELDGFIQKHRKNVVDYSDLLQIKSVRKNLFITIEERKNLLVRNLKKAVSTNRKAHAYLVKTAGAKGQAKIWKRILGIPYIAFVLLESKRSEKKRKHF